MATVADLAAVSVVSEAVPSVAAVQVEAGSFRCDGKEKGQILNFEDLSSVAPELGLEPRTL